jgi:sodium transport system permease protein
MITRETLEHILIVFSKEVQDNLRDIRSLMSALVVSLLGPLMMLFLIFVLGRQISAEIVGQDILLPVQGSEYAPNLVNFLQQNGVMVIPIAITMEEEIGKGIYEMGLVIPEEFSRDFSEGRTARLRIITDSSGNSTPLAQQKLQSLLDSYSRSIVNLRMLARGVHPDVLKPIEIEQVNLASEESTGALLFGIMPYFIGMAVFLGGNHVIIDAIAGERERGSLEPLLTNPIYRSELLVGKALSAFPFAAFIIIAMLLAFWAVFTLFPIEAYLGFRVHMPFARLIGIFLLTLPMILLASGLQMIIATFTRSYKEAQTYVSFLPLLPALPGLVLAFMSIKTELWTMLTPLLSQQILFSKILRGGEITITEVVISSLATLLVALLLIWFATRLYKKEHVLFGTN